MNCQPLVYVCVGVTTSRRYIVNRGLSVGRRPSTSPFLGRSLVICVVCLLLLPLQKLIYRPAVSGACIVVKVHVPVRQHPHQADGPPIAPLLLRDVPGVPHTRHVLVGVTPLLAQGGAWVWGGGLGLGLSFGFGLGGLLGLAVGILFCIALTLLIFVLAFCFGGPGGAWAWPCGGGKSHHHYCCGSSSSSSSCCYCCCCYCS